jgi:hypothetical protein
VLDKSVEEVNAYSDLFIQPELERAGRKVIRVRFKLSLREKKKWLGINLMEKGRAQEANSDNQDLLTTLSKEFLIEKTKAKNLIDTYGIKYLEDKINFVKTSIAYKKGNIANITGYLLNAIKQNYQNREVEEVISEKIKEKDDIQIKQKKLEIEKTELFNQYNKYVALEYDKLFFTLSQEEQDNIIQGFESYIRDNRYSVGMYLYKQHGLQDMSVKAIFREYINKNYRELVPGVKPFEEFSSSSEILI